MPKPGALAPGLTRTGRPLRDRAGVLLHWEDPMRTRMKNLFLPSLALMLALPAAAEQARAGVQAAVVFPQNDLRTNVDGTLGLSLGVSVDFNLQGGNELRPRLDYTQCDTQAFHMLALSTTSKSVHGTSLGVDYLRFFEGGRRGVYGLVGTGIAWWSASDPTFGNTHETAPFIKVGAGFRFDSEWGAEITYGVGRFRNTQGTGGMIQAGVTYRF